MKSFLKVHFVRWRHSPALEALPSYCVSIATHLVALLLLAAIVMRLAPKGAESMPVEVFGSDGPDAAAEPLDNVRLSADTVEKLHDGCRGIAI